MTLQPARSACSFIVAFSVELMDTLTGPNMIAKYGVSMWTMSRASRMYVDSCRPLVRNSLLNMRAWAQQRLKKAGAPVKSLMRT